MDVREEHPLKHDGLKLVTDDGMVTDVREEQSRYLLLVDYQYYTL